jgi:death on curing protein
MQYLWLGIDQALEIHRSLIDRYGGSQGIRDVGLLESALAQPEAMFGGQYLQTDIFEMAAAYLFHLVKNHPFIDGNKRVGAAAAIVFLALNEVEIEADEDGIVELTLAVAQGEVAKPQIAEFFRAHAE